MKRKPTEKQKAAARDRRERIRRLQKEIKAMPAEQRQQLVDQIGAVLRIEGGTLSPKNTVLCYYQRQGVSVIGGFRQWLRAGRAVNKGEQGIVICIPCTRKSENTETGDEGEETFFSYATVFDISQTHEIETETETQKAA